MRTAKEFLVQECSNLGAVLDETLRFKYGLDGSSEFFTECQVRLKFLTKELKATAETDFGNLWNYKSALEELSGLIARIERSSVGEYSWPFVEQLKKIADAMCAEATLTNPNSLPKVHVLSDGGLGAYRIYPENNRPSAAEKRILTIVFPRTLKHFVLLHSILGHELGHAMWRCSKHQNALRTIVKQELQASGPFADQAATAKWLYDASAPLLVKQQLADIKAKKNITQANFFGLVADWDAWVEEILCDFVGLVTFGPSFVAAACNLLYALDPYGVVLGPLHPPVACRANYLLAAASELAFDAPAYGDEALNTSVQAFWTSLHTKRKPDPWLDVFQKNQIKRAAEAIATLIGPLVPAAYTTPSESDLALLMDQLRRLIPPVGFTVGHDLSFQTRTVDFRHVLYAGWITSANSPNIPFVTLNKLCEYGIMQQMAIDIDRGPDPHASAVT